jgi:hypothetical protein
MDIAIVRQAVYLETVMSSTAHEINQPQAMATRKSRVRRSRDPAALMNSAARPEPCVADAEERARPSKPSAHFMAAALLPK